MKIEIEWNESDLIYRQWKSEKEHGTWERPIRFSDFTTIGKIIDLIESSYNRRVGEQEVKEIKWTMKTEDDSK